MKRLKKWFFIVFIIGGLLSLPLIYLTIFHSYHDDFYTSVQGESTKMELFSYNGDENKNGIINGEEVAANAEQLVGTLYDPLKGGYYNVGGKLGFIVCIDVPRIAFGQAGISLSDLLYKDYQNNPEHYDTENGINTPETPYFFRRVRNVYDFADGNNFLIKDAETPKVGDIVFYGRYHATMVTAVHDDGTYNEVEAHPSLVFVKEHKQKEWEPRDVARFFE